MKTFIELLWVFMDVLQCSCFVLVVHTKNKRFVSFDSKRVFGCLFVFVK